jgi:hypothetical protein
VIRRGDGFAIHPELARQHANGLELRAGLDTSRFDGAAQVLHDLLGNRLSSPTLNRNQHAHRLAHGDWPDQIQ